MAWVLRRKSGEAISVDGEVSIGRAAQCTIRIQTPAVSRVHCRLQPSSDHVIVTDEGKNGTLVNGIRIGKVAHIGPGDVIEVDTEQFQLQRVADGANVPRPPLAAPPPPEERVSITASGDYGSQAPVPTLFPPPPAPSAAASASYSLAAPTTETPAIFDPAKSSVALEVEVVEDVGAPQLRYRDAVRMDDHALLVVTDFANGTNLSPDLILRWKGIVRKAGSKGRGPDAILQLLNQELFDAQLQATGTCARLDLRERLVVVACAGSAPPFILRGGNRVVRVQASPTVGLGRVRGSHFTERSLHFDRGDTLLVPSAAWVAPLEGILGTSVALNDLRAAEWLRRHRVQPPGASLLCLDLR